MDQYVVLMLIFPCSECKCMRIRNIAVFLAKYHADIYIYIPAADQLKNASSLVALQRIQLYISPGQSAGCECWTSRN